MKKLGILMAAALMGGCAGGATKEDLNLVRRELDAADKSLKGDLETKFAGVQQVGNKMEARLAEIEKLEKLLATANNNYVRLLEFEEKLLAERLATVRALLEELKK